MVLETVIDDEDGELTLVPSRYKTVSGFQNVRFNPRPELKRPWQATQGDNHSLGMYATAKEAAAAYARFLGPAESRQRAEENLYEASRPTLDAAECERLAAEEGLTLIKGDPTNSTPYKYVYRFTGAGQGPRQYLALLNVIVEGKRLSLGCYHSAEEAALQVARKLAQVEREKKAAANQEKAAAAAAAASAAAAAAASAAVP